MTGIFRKNWKFSNPKNTLYHPYGRRDQRCQWIQCKNQF